MKNLSIDIKAIIMVLMAVVVVCASLLMIYNHYL